MRGMQRTLDKHDWRGPRRFVPVATLAAPLCAVLLFIAHPTFAPWEVGPRLVLAGFLTLFLPGWSVIAGSRGWQRGLHPVESAALSVILSYVIVSALCIVVTVFRLNLGIAAFLVLGLEMVTLLAWRGGGDADRAGLGGLRRVAGEDRVAAVLLVSLTTAVVAFAWVIEPPISGEEVVELITVRKLLENPSIALTNVLHRPDAIPTYIFCPYYFMIALVAKLSGLSPFVAYAKLRAVYVAIAFVAFWVVAYRLGGRRRFATCALLALVVLLIVDPDPWSWPASMFPLTRRGAFASGVLLPLFIWVVLYTLRGRWKRRRSMALVASTMLVLTMTHALEAVFALFFAGSLAVSLFCACRGRKARWEAVTALLPAVAVLLAYRLVHSIAVRHVVEYEAQRRTVTWASVVGMMHTPFSALAGGVPDGGVYLLTKSGAVTPYAVFPVILLPLAILLSRRATVVWATMTLPLILYVTPLGYSVLVLATTSDIMFAGGYFSFLGFMAFCVIASSVAGALSRTLGAATRRLSVSPTAGAIVLWGCAGVIGAVVLLPTSEWLMYRFVRTPGLAVAIATAAGMLAIAARRFHWAAGMAQLSPRTSPLLIAFLCLVIPVLLGLRSFPGQIEGSSRGTMWSQFIARRNIPSVVDWPAYYPYLQASARPTIDFPRHIVDDLSRVLPAQSVVVYDPRHSYTLPLLLNVYVVNPGFVLSTDMDYLTRYVRRGTGTGDVHPLFNDAIRLTNEELEFLRRYGVQYIVANPTYQRVLSAKLAAFPGAFRLVYSREGFEVYEVIRLPGNVSSRAMSWTFASES